MNHDEPQQEPLNEQEPESPVEASAEEWQEAVDALAGDELSSIDEIDANDEPDELFAESFEGDDVDESEDVEEFEAGPIRIIDDHEPSVASGDLELVAAEPDDVITATHEELKPAIEAILFVAEEPLPIKQLSKILGDVAEEDVRAAVDELVAEYDARQSGLEFREIAGGWRVSTRPQHHEFLRKYLKSRPSARLSLPALETLAVVAYKQPITAPEILEIRGVTSSSAIKTLLEKRLIVTKGRKETVGRPMMYGTSKEFLIQFGLKDLTELPSIEDFEDLAQ
jgi:segregation and condensation protein B